MEFIFTDSNAKKNFPSMNKNSLERYKLFFNKIGAKKILINSSYRAGGGFHGKGQSLDLHSVLGSNYGDFYFTARSAEYTDTKDQQFYKIIKYYLGNQLLEYISPSKIYLLNQKIDTNNKYRFSSRTEKVKILDKMKSENLPYETSRNHLHHLHLSLSSGPIQKTELKIIESNYQSKSDILFYSIPIIIGAGFFYKNKIKKAINENKFSKWI